ncbi:hypothetical protein [Nocardiopsis potens]|uniref:hypothetical protein n=1 Tax=Nocardiopsis potens TaxID=1246458 RepID=UPI00034AAB05|nr:hypothetical protein [Nocardiopsis potens]
MPPIDPGLWRRSCAVHEAAHAAVAHRLGVGVRHIALDSAPGPWGGVASLRTRGADPQAVAVVLEAGAAAQARVLAEAGAAPGEAARRVAQGAAGDRELIAAAVAAGEAIDPAAAREAAARLVAQEQDAITALAAALLDAQDADAGGLGLLMGEEVAAIIAGVRDDGAPTTEEVR